MIRWKFHMLEGREAAPAGCGDIIKMGRFTVAKGKVNFVDKEPSRDTNVHQLIDGRTLTEHSCVDVKKAEFLTREVKNLSAKSKLHMDRVESSL